MARPAFGLVEMFAAPVSAESLAWAHARADDDAAAQAADLFGPLDKFVQAPAEAAPAQALAAGDSLILDVVLATFVAGRACESDGVGSPKATETMATAVAAIARLRASLGLEVK